MTSKVHWSSKTSEWGTPRDFFEHYNKQFDFTLDVCATASNAKCHRYFSIDDNGLEQPWANERCWCNPPYGRGENGPKPWLEKGVAERCNGATVVFLLAARTDTCWFHDLIKSYADEIEFIRGRIWFESINGVQYPAPFPSMVVTYLPRTIT